MVRTSTDSQLNGGFDGAARFLLNWWTLGGTSAGASRRLVGRDSL